MRRKSVFARGFIILGILSLPYFAGCGGSGASMNQPPPPSKSNPIPTMTTISPANATAGSGAFVLTINGTNFMAASLVKFGGTTATTTFVNATQLTAAIPATYVASIGMVPVTVTNPPPGGGTSNPIFFTIANISVPAIIGLSPGCAPVGGHAFTLDVIGSNFVGTSVVRWNGSARPTGFVDNQEIHAEISASDIAAPGTAAVTVFTPGSGSSNSSNFTVAPGGVGPRSVAIDPTGKFAYMANAGCPSAFAGNVSMYTINPTSGALTSIGPPVAAGSATRSVAVDPSGRFAYVGNEFSVDISMYTIDSTTGTLTPMGTVSAAGRAVSVAVHPSGKFAYVANGCFKGSVDSISMYAVDTTSGALTSVGTMPTEAVGPSACSIDLEATIDASGRFAYVASDGCGLDTFDTYVSIYTINPTTGALTAVGKSVSAFTCSGSLSVGPLSKFAYLTNSDSNNVSMYTINSTTGALTSTGTIAAGSGPSSIAIHPSGKFAYVANRDSNDISAYTINSGTGALTLIGTIAAGSSPSSIAIHPSAKFAYVANWHSNNVSMYSIDDATGALTLIGTVGT